VEVRLNKSFQVKAGSIRQQSFARIDMKPVYSEDVVDYAFKALKNGNATPDDIQVYH
jgi:hypothetical protein